MDGWQDSCCVGLDRHSMASQANFWSPDSKLIMAVLLGACAWMDVDTNKVVINARQVRGENFMVCSPHFFEQIALLHPGL